LMVGTQKAATMNEISGTCALPGVSSVTATHGYESAILHPWPLIQSASNARVRLA
jgi:hypothetical protein